MSLLEHLLLICMQGQVLSDYHWLLQENADPPSFGYQLRHRRGKLETTRAQYINTKDVRLTISTWNVAGRVPDEKLDIDDCISSKEPSDIYIFG
ncbi:type I inositol polyphosphate 5-phosphatase 2-like isoform X2 [Rosa chinensis]|nr:type I inositol polyphosphate 5-phosphatase 2-like isoform X2 [Rosa chinensis]